LEGLFDNIEINQNKPFTNPMEKFITINEKNSSAFQSEINYYLNEGYVLHGEPTVQVVGHSSTYRPWSGSTEEATSNWTSKHYFQCMKLPDDYKSELQLAIEDALRHKASIMHKYL
jgi:hypothetical protein